VFLDMHLPLDADWSGDTMPGEQAVVLGAKFLDYDVVSLLGKGGMSEVYLVRKADKCYALKMLLPDLARANPEFVKRFEREARIAIRLRHPNLVAVHDVGYDKEFGRHYLVMDYVDGYDLRSAIALGGAMEPKEAVDVVLAVASVLEAGECLGLVHRDIKPENIMVESDGTVKLLDLGVAKARGTDSLNTMQRTVFGTPNYISPEQAQDASKVDSRADVYSLGVVFYEMLSGKRPYECDKPGEVLAKLLSPEELPDVREKNPAVPEKLAAVLRLMLAKDPSKRIESASKLIAVLKSLGYDASERPARKPGPVNTVQPDFRYSSYSSAEANHTLSFETKDKEIQSFVASLKARRRNERILRWTAILLTALLVAVVVAKLVI